MWSWMSKSTLPPHCGNSGFDSRSEAVKDAYMNCPHGTHVVIFTDDCEYVTRKTVRDQVRQFIEDIATSIDVDPGLALEAQELLDALDAESEK